MVQRPCAVGVQGSAPLPDVTGLDAGAGGIRCSHRARRSGPARRGAKPGDPQRRRWTCRRPVSRRARWRRQTPSRCWGEYNRRAGLYVERFAVSRLVVWYDELVEAPATQVRRIAAFVDCRNGHIDAAVQCVTPRAAPKPRMTVCLCTLAIHAPYRNRARLLCADAPTVPWTILTDEPDDFAGLPVRAIRHVPTGPMAMDYLERLAPTGNNRGAAAYHDKRFALLAALRDFDTAIFLDADSRLDAAPPLGRFPSGLAVLPVVQKSVAEHLETCGSWRLADLRRAVATAHRRCRHPPVGAMVPRDLFCRHQGWARVRLLRGLGACRAISARPRSVLRRRRRDWTGGGVRGVDGALRSPRRHRRR